MSMNSYQLPFLPPNTIVPENDALFIPYLNRLYEDISFTVNNKEAKFFPIPITNTATNIPNMPNFGSFLVCVSGVDHELPTLITALCKSNNAAAGTIAVLTSQAGTGATWAGITLTITSTTTNYQIAHSLVTVPVTTGNFNIRIVSTQELG